MTVIGRIQGRKYGRTDMVAAQTGKKIIVPLQYDGTMDSRIFSTALAVWPSDSFLPPYSPELNANENSRASLKANFLRVLPSLSSFDDALRSCFILFDYSKSDPSHPQGQRISGQSAVTESLNGLQFYFPDPYAPWQ